MDAYFENITKKMTIEEMDVLAFLYEKDANASFKAVKRQQIQETTGMTPTEFRKVIEKLTATQFIDIVYGKKEHRVFLTVFGKEALEQSIEEEEEE
ncbi:hypothetical protein AAXE64_27785 [Priestia megaterium]|uniref:hypothetical protein n=1 Tax=Priestia megaterium TaxID=1404 RepID=UPI003D044879